MLKEYTLSDLLPGLSGYITCYASAIETMTEPEVEWPHRQSFYSLVWFTEGEGFNVIDFTEYPILPGRVFLRNPEQICNWSYSGNCKGYVLMFSKSLAAQLNIEFEKPCIDIEKGDGTLLQLVFERLVGDYQMNQEDAPDKIKASIQYIHSLIADKIPDETFSPEHTNATFRKFKELIMADDIKIRSMDKYADTLHISTAVLNSICQDFAGSSAKQLLLDLKMTEAKRLLLYSRLRINEISSQLGFDDSSYFARIFRKKTALSPSRFQEKYRK